MGFNPSLPKRTTTIAATGATIRWTEARTWLGAYAFVSPAIAVLLGVVVFGEVITRVDALGMATMLAGAWLTLRPAPGHICQP